MDDIEELRRLLQEAEQKRKEEQRKREEAERRAKRAEELAIESQPLTLPQYLNACHSIDLAIEVVTDCSLTTQGPTTNPTGRLYPKQIIPWDEFPILQAETWDQLSISSSFSSQQLFPSLHQLQYVKSSLHPISSEDGLRYVARDAVENAVERLVKEAFNDLSVRNAVGLDGTIIFESHLNLGNSTDSAPESREKSGQGDAHPKTPARKLHHKAKGKVGRPDQFCIYKTLDGRSVAALAIEYKPPHKLTIDEVAKGLEAEIHLDRDVINQDGKGFAFHARRLSAAVITQLFSYMINKGIQYGYVCTGQTFVFLNIPDDPSIVYSSVCVPKLDVQEEDDEIRLHRTAVAQVFAFILRALKAKPPPASWHDRARELKTWAVEVDKILLAASIEDRKPKASKTSLYKAQGWKGFKRSPIRTRHRCKEPDDVYLESTDEDRGPPSPTARLARPVRQVRKAAPSTGTSSSRAGAEQSQHQGTKSSIQDRPFCTQECLFGLAYGGPLDKNCPNIIYHGKGHINRLKFLQLIRAQLATDRGHDADCTPLHLTGSRGSLFKLRLSSHGYTLVAKGVEDIHYALLQHEHEIYNQLQAIQGKYIPVCLGNIDLVLPCYYDCGVYIHFMLLSWAGKPLFDCYKQTTKASLLEGATKAIKQLHRFQVLHHDAEARNMLYNTDTGNLMIVDFERAELRSRQPLGGRKRKRRIAQKHADFARELRIAVELMERAIGHAYT